MLFNSVVFLFVFLPVTYTVFWLLRSVHARHVWITVTGYIFYGYWDARFCILMAFSTVISFGAGLAIAHAATPVRRRLFLVLPIAIDLGLLGYFKYADFGLETTRSVLQLAGVDVNVPHLDIVLPIGISFYTFHTITYIVDCYRGVITPTRSFFEFSTYVSLFSQLVAGPIVRFRQIEGDLEAMGNRYRMRWFEKGISFFVIGLVEKVLIADSLAAFVDPALLKYGTLSTAATWIVMIGYSLQLYFDFSGYSTMAVGLGLLFGVRIPQNFNSPYKARDPVDFWRRWHISLSLLLRDYIYIPLGGNRGRGLKVRRNLMVTMLIGGLWHGASWTFVVWGAYHGALLLAYRASAARWDALPARLRQALMFLLVVVGWVFFRASDFGMAVRMLRTMFWVHGGSFVQQPALPLIALCIAATWALFGPNAFELKHEHRFRGKLALASSFAAALAIILGNRPSPFLYFQF